MVALRHMPPPEFFEAEEKSLIVGPERKRLWAVLLDLLVEFGRVCEKHSIPWSIDGGTMLGARRHGGFIPWDDDIDVIMLRSEYERLKEIAPREFQYPYFLQNNDTDPECIRGHAQFRNSATTAILKAEWDGSQALYHFNQGVFIDVFVLDNVPDNECERASFFSELAELKRKMLEARRRLSYRFRMEDLRSLRGFYDLGCHFFWRFRQWIAGGDLLHALGARLDLLAQKYNSVECRDVSHLTYEPTPTEKVIFRRDKLKELERVRFEGIEVPCLRESDYYLTHFYGDWHRHVVGGTCHGGMIIDVDKPYAEYLRK